MNVYIYGLIDPRDNTIFYVGQTYQPDQRMKNHISEAMTTPIRALGPKYRRVRDILTAGQPLRYVVLEVTDDESSVTREMFWIATLRSAGNGLVNKCRPGRPSGRHSVNRIL